MTLKMRGLIVSVYVHKHNREPSADENDGFVCGECLGNYNEIYHIKARDYHNSHTMEMWWCVGCIKGLMGALTKAKLTGRGEVTDATTK